MKTMAMALTGALLALTPSSSAQVRGWLDFGPGTPGESIDPGHENWTPVLSFTSKHDADGFELCASKEIDKSSPLLAKACVAGTHFTSVQLDVQKSVDGSPTTFWQYTLKDVVITSFSSSGDSPESPALPPKPILDQVCMTWKSLSFSVRTFPASGPSYAVTRIISPDTDRDSLPDAYEEQFGLNPDIANWETDSDGDGVKDVDEYRLGTKPNDPTSFFQVIGTIEDPPSGSLTLTWPSVSGEAYTIEYSPDLEIDFTPLATVTAVGERTVHSVPRTLASGFFRVAIPTP